MLTHDIDLSYKDIQALDSPDALAAFFARLGYDTNHRLVQHAAAIGITGDNLTSSIQHIERLASQEGSLLEVYLFQLRSLTVANTQNIVRNFRNRSGDYLFVLTDNYDRLDFVLLERYSPATNALHDTADIPGFPDSHLLCSQTGRRASAHPHSPTPQPRYRILARSAPLHLHRERYLRTI